MVAVASVIMLRRLCSVGPRRPAPRDGSGAKGPEQLVSPLAGNALERHQFRNPQPQTGTEHRENGNWDPRFCVFIKR